MKNGLRISTNIIFTVLMLLLAGAAAGHAQAVDTDTADVGLEVTRSCPSATVTSDAGQEVGDSGQMQAVETAPASMGGCPTPTVVPVPPTPREVEPGVTVTPSPTVTVPAGTESPTASATSTMAPGETPTVPPVNKLPETGAGASADHVSMFIVVLSASVLLAGVVSEIRQSPPR